MNIGEFVTAAKAGPVTVEFRKIKTNELRKMHCTLNTELAPLAEVVTDTDQAKMEHVVVWCLDLEEPAWRSFRVSTVEKWYEGAPEA
jgi:hypothetical protein|tara:strand:+ start:99 stop:359 length:261 start_codon:yes stop_codon:yes gene_type:complete